MERPRNFKLILTAAFLALIIGAGWFIFGKSSAFNRSSESVSTASADARISDRRERPDAEGQRSRKKSLLLAGEKWYQQLLEKYPDMKPVFRDVPDEQNGYLQLLLFAKKVKEPRLSEELNEMLRGHSPWDADRFKTWLAENQDYADQILRIAELPDQSAKGLDFDQMLLLRKLPYEFGGILTSSARLAFENGDADSALRFMRASLQLSDHLVDIEVPSMMGRVVAESIRAGARDCFSEAILPSIAQNPEALHAWDTALSRQEKPASEYARALIGEWNFFVKNALLSGLLGEPTLGEAKISFPGIDADGLMDAYTNVIRKSAAGISAQGPDRFDVASAAFDPSGASLDPKTAERFEAAISFYGNITQAIGNHLTKTTLQSAALSILQGKEPPPDPVSGQPFPWDPNTRLLSPPAGTNGIDPIRVP